MAAIYFLAITAVVLGAVECGKPYCRFGYEKSCGSYNNFRCPKRTYCKTSKLSVIGLCCYLKPRPEDKCQYGQMGVCGGIAGLPCQDGYKCEFIPTDIADGMGKCCKDKPKGVCPPSSGPGTCEFDPTRNCLKDSECPKDYMCCPEGCGMVCKHRESGIVYPGPLLVRPF